MFINEKKIGFIFWIALMSFLGVVSPGQAASLEKDVNEGNQHYKEGQYDLAIEKYDEAIASDPESDVVNFNLGTAYYKKGDYNKTIEHLQKSLLSEEEDLKEKTYYNLGNTFYRAGIAEENTNIEAAIEALEVALTQYESALKIQSEDEDAKFNHDFVKKEIARLRQKQQEQKNQPQQQKQDEEQDQPKDQQNQNPSDSKGQPSDQSQQSPSDQGKQEEPQDQEEQAKPQDSQESEEQSQSQAAQEAAAEQAEQEPTDGEDYTKKEAEMLIENYQMTEEPKELLNVNKRWRRRQPVLKDW